MLKLNQVYCGYDNFEICRNINVHIDNGQFTSIIGPNGAGKTTLLKAIAGIVDYKGDVTLGLKDIRRLNRKELGQKIALLSQIGETYFSYSIYDTVMLGRYPYLKGLFGIPSHQDREIVDDALFHVGLYDVKDSMINTLSGGQLQRVFLARTLAQEPDVFLLDEPTNHLDFKHQIEILDFVKDWVKKENKIVVAVLHDLNLVQKYSDQVILLEHGETYAIGDAKQVLSNENLNNVYGVDVKQWMKTVLSLWE